MYLIGKSLTQMRNVPVVCKIIPQNTPGLFTIHARGLVFLSKLATSLPDQKIWVRVHEGNKWKWKDFANRTVVSVRAGQKGNRVKGGTEKREGGEGVYLYENRGHARSVRDPPPFSLGIFSKPSIRFKLSLHFYCTDLWNRGTWNGLIYQIWYHVILFVQ